MNVVILAAGKGKRMHSNLPKVLHPLAGKPLLGHVLDTARSLAPESLCVVVGHGGEVVRQAVAAPDVQFGEQSPQLGTGHAVQQALPYLGQGSHTLVLYGDVPLVQESTLKRLLAAAQDGLAVLTVDLDNPQGYGRILRNPAGQVTAIVEEKDASDAQRAIREVNTGIMAIPTAHLADWLGALSNNNAQGEYYLTDLIGLAVTQGVPVRTAHPEGPWEVLGVNSKTQLAELERILQGRIGAQLLEAGVRLADPARLDVRGELVCGRDVGIDVGCVFEGRVVLEEAVEVGPYCVLKNVTVAAGARIAAFSHLDGARVGPDAVVGPYARLRPGTTLEAGAHVGNFVELKNTTLGAGSKANHLAYVGDATVGTRVNIGAGTITCNYDGVNKFRTVIEDDAFIGSDTQLVAPVTVGRGATLGAGTTLTKDAPPNTLTISRAKQLAVPGWQRPQKKV
ncbi:bifunctional UDP-N-acetylglucosamine diphosphorylase/glucosamine-1-phosphate N-acetyltransferase GlmU [Azospira inquinata]|uniref:Bifunctional protein GlmU n=1 Tax=Azospira inquinata TaxID=2785627 RepID=A0A975XVP3_9RHOO|nr:bifunctional UDP-N-acetylglucosamine diphosphorylase/glucosamine-1-phosphate N-acetyltransferase GlmU [Azospira inquinata]QWT47318.1 bifunctional UDP-N-acetylglucosamine diphosphorylase/glucosamine-1-phosphate N-acetyltransferase GlmU [Azospira inquinata]QWT50057.1 bifunctional UDP-N-acetylglucosamine diphosphorylase/glucosamine-1-phosphate N-acetyltransferase GlmU [Azospira inquinata]